MDFIALMRVFWTRLRALDRRLCRYTSYACGDLWLADWVGFQAGQPRGLFFALHGGSGDVRVRVGGYLGFSLTLALGIPKPRNPLHLDMLKA